MQELIYPSHPVLLVDDEKEALFVAEMALRCAGISHIVCCQDSREVMGLIMKQPPSVVVLDLSMPYLSGQALLKQIQEDYPEIPAIVVTGHNDIETAIECMKNGAIDYMVKPVEENRLASGLRRVIEHRELQGECNRLKESLLASGAVSPDAFSGIVTKSPAMKTLFRYVEAVAKTPRPILITGETGVGKELMARAIHTLSELPGPFIAINVAGLDDNLFSDTLFGHRKGAFTGADEAQKGLVEQASGGTLFLDEIGDLSALSQVKLLRLIQEGEYFPLGSNVVSKALVRMIVATNCDLDALRNAGQFRKDLYYRLQTHRVHIPPLRKRMEDVGVLIDHFIEKASQTLNCRRPTTPPELFNLLNTHDFPGNIRELESMVFDAVSNHKSGVLSMKTFKEHVHVTGKDHVLSEDASSPLAGTEFSASIASWRKLPTIRECTQTLIDEALRRSGNNQSVAAGLIGISPPSLNRRLHHPKE